MSKKNAKPTHDAPVQTGTDSNPDAAVSSDDGLVVQEQAGATLDAATVPDPVSGEGTGELAETSTGAPTPVASLPVVDGSAQTSPLLAEMLDTGGDAPALAIGAIPETEALPSFVMLDAPFSSDGGDGILIYPEKPGGNPLAQRIVDLAAIPETEAPPVEVRPVMSLTELVNTIEDLEWYASHGQLPMQSRDVIASPGQYHVEGSEWLIIVHEGETPAEAYHESRWAALGFDLEAVKRVTPLDIPA
jgi:hypothetical protein